VPEPPFYLERESNVFSVPLSGLARRWFTVGVQQVEEGGRRVQTGCGATGTW